MDTSVVTYHQANKAPRMNLKDYLDIRLLEKHIEEGIVEACIHENNDLILYNYTHECTQQGRWDGVTVKTRGLICTLSGEIVARPFQKFFNINTSWLPDTLETNLVQLGEPEILDKLDGCLGTAYFWENKWSMASRGRFHSPLAGFGTLYLRKLPNEWPQGYTPVFELIWKNHPIICRYDFDDIVLTGLVHKETGAEMPWADLSGWAEQNGCRVVERVNTTFAEALNDARTKTHPNKEGWVFNWSLGDDCPPLKVKVKFSEYLAASRVAQRCTSVQIWEMMREGRNLTEVQKFLPDHLRSWMEKEVLRLRMRYNSLERQAKQIAQTLVGKPRKDAAEYINKTGDIAPVLWMIYDNRPAEHYGKYIYKMIRPKINEQPLELVLR